MKSVAPLRPIGDLESIADTRFQKRSWRVQRIGQSVALIFIALAVLGVFGGGGLARRELTSPEGKLTVNYPCFVRSQSGGEWRLQVEHSGDETETIWVDSTLLRALKVESITPAPIREAWRDGRWQLEFAVGATERGVLEVRINVRSRGAGWADGRIGTSKGSAVGLWQVIYP